MPTIHALPPELDLQTYAPNLTSAETSQHAPNMEQQEYCRQLLTILSIVPHENARGSPIPVNFDTVGIAFEGSNISTLQLLYIFAEGTRLLVMNRSTIPSWRQDSSAVVSMLTVSPDSYIRLSFAKLQTISLVHLISGLDENSPAIIHGGAMPTEITGYTEWVNTTTPAITIGWDWQMDADHNQILLRRISDPRSNLMLQDSTGMDVGPAKTMIMLEALIDVLDWTNEARNYIDIRYGK